MKLSEGVIDSPLTGECKIDTAKIAKCFGMSIVSRYHDTYRLCNQRLKLKITIAKEDALELIRVLNLVEVSSPIFANASTFMTKRRMELI